MQPHVPVESRNVLEASVTHGALDRLRPTARKEIGEITAHALALQGFPWREDGAHAK